MLAESNINTGWDIFDGSISDTWENADMSGVVPAGTKGLLGFTGIYTTDAQDRMLLCIRPEGSTYSTTRAETLWMQGEQGAAQLWWGGPLTIVAPDGQFEYRRYSSSYVISSFYYRLLGYYL